MRLGINFIIYFLSLFLIYLTIWLKENFGNPSIDQIFWHLDFNNIETSDHEITDIFIRQCIITPLKISLLLIVLEYLYNKYLCRRSYNKTLDKIIKTISKIIKSKKYIISILLLSIVWLLWSVSFFRYVKAQFEEDFFAKYYIHPSSVEIQPSSPLKNLVLIYVESLENSYNNVTVFDKNLISKVENIEGVSFSSYKQVLGTEWTGAAIVSTQCGLPLKRHAALYHVNEQGEKVKTFLSNAICLGDILKTYGYQNIFMGGASLNFAGKGKFLETHGYDELFGREEWLEEGVNPEDMNNWGIYDDELFSRAKIKLKELHDSNKPFNLTLLTVDTHHPYGHMSKLCRERGAVTFEDIVKCDADQVAEFVDFIKDKGYLHDTNVVVIGDHLVMGNLIIEKLEKGDRSIFNKFISKDSFKKNREEILHFDLFPTILEFIGFDVVGDKLGLGYSGFSRENILPEENRYKDFIKSLNKNSPLYKNLW